ncbi:MAG: hypothetical protein R8F89_06600 [Roseobacter sp.]|nr:hypothetical protein [Roseobacter sp.]
MEQIELQWTADIQRYGMKREPLAASQIGGNRARAARHAVRSMIASVGHDGPQQEKADELGVQLYDELSSFVGKYSLRGQTEEYFKKCSGFVGQYLVTGNNWVKLRGYFRSPPR